MDNQTKHMSLKELLELLRRRTDLRYLEVQIFLEPDPKETRACVQITAPEEPASYVRYVLARHGVETITTRYPTTQGLWYRETFPVDIN